MPSTSNSLPLSCFHHQFLERQGLKEFEGDLPETQGLGWTLAGRGRWFPFYFMALCDPKEEVCPKSFYPIPFVIFEIFCKDVSSCRFAERELPWLKLIGQANNCNS